MPSLDDGADDSNVSDEWLQMEHMKRQKQLELMRMQEAGGDTYQDTALVVARGGGGHQQPGGPLVGPQPQYGRGAVTGFNNQQHPEGGPQPVYGRGAVVPTANRATPKKPPKNEKPTKSNTDGAPEGLMSPRLARAKKGLAKFGGKLAGKFKRSDSKQVVTADTTNNKTNAVNNTATMTPKYGAPPDDQPPPLGSYTTDSTALGHVSGSVAGTVNGNLVLITDQVCPERKHLLLLSVVVSRELCSNARCLDARWRIGRKKSSSFTPKNDTRRLSTRWDAKARCWNRTL